MCDDAVVEDGIREMVGTTAANAKGDDEAVIELTSDEVAHLRARAVSKTAEDDLLMKAVGGPLSRLWVYVRADQANEGATLLFLVLRRPRPIRVTYVVRAHHRLYFSGLAWG